MEKPTDTVARGGATIVAVNIKPMGSDIPWGCRVSEPSQRGTALLSDQGTDLTTTKRDSVRDTGD